MSNQEVAQHVIGGKRLQPTEQMQQVAGAVFAGCLESRPESRPTFAELVEQFKAIDSKLRTTEQTAFAFDDVEDELVNYNRRVSFAIAKDEQEPVKSTAGKPSGYKVMTFQRNKLDETTGVLLTDAAPVAASNTTASHDPDSPARAADADKVVGFSYV